MVSWRRPFSSGGAPLRFEPADAAFVSDPYPLFDALRDHQPVHRSPGGAWVLTRYEDVRAALEDERLGNAPARYAVVHERNRARYVCADVAAHILPFLDPPHHAEPRRALARAFHERLRRRPLDLSGTAEHLLAQWHGHPTRDVVADFASPLAVQVIAKLLGVPRADFDRVESWSASFFYLFAAMPSVAVREEVDEALTDFRGYLHGLARERRATPGDDLITDLQAGNVDLSEEQIVDNCMLLIADGVENVDRAVGNATYTLLRHPEQLALLRKEPALLGQAIEECLRYESPAQYIGRIALRDVEMHGVTIPQGGMVLLVLGAANRDPHAFAHPHRFDITRSPNPHLAFGRGSHSCIGGTLVAVEMAAAVECLVQGLPGLRLAEDTVSFVPRPGHRWIERLRVRWD